MKQKSWSISQTITQFAAGLDGGNLPSDVVDIAKKLILDWIGCAISGAAHPASAPIRLLLSQLGGNGQAEHIGGEKTSVVLASLAHAYYGHILELDDIDRTSITHPGTVILPALFSVTDIAGISGKDFIAAAVAGYEAQLRIGAAVSPAHYEIFHTTSTVGVFGAAIAAGKALGLRKEQLDWALGNAGSLSSGLMQFLPEFLQGGKSKFLHTGTAAANGVLVALLAKNGLSGADDILEGRQGFFAGFARQSVEEAIFRDFGKVWRILAVSIKPYPCCRHTHSAVDAAEVIRLRVQGRRFKQIRLYTYKTAVGFAGYRHPQDSRQARFSLSYCVASTLVRGLPKETDFSDASVKNKIVSAMEKSVEVIVDEQLNATVPARWPARLEVITEDGEKIVADVPTCKGDPEDPLDWQDIEFKFRQQADGVIAGESQEKIIQICRMLENIPYPGELLSVINSSFVRKGALG